MSKEPLTTATAEKLITECLKECGTREQLIERLHWAGVGINVMFAAFATAYETDSWGKFHEGLADEIGRLARLQKLPSNN